MLSVPSLRCFCELGGIALLDPVLQHVLLNPYLLLKIMKHILVDH